MKIVDKFKEAVGMTDKRTPEDKLLEKAQRRLEIAMSDHESFIAECGEYDDLYNGTHNIEGSTQQAEQVVNMIYKNIEASIEPYLPQPRVDPYEENDLLGKKMIEGQLMQLAQSPELLALNNENERVVKKNSIAFFKVGFDPDFDFHTSKGKIKITSPHPVNVVPQPNVYKIEDMDYIFHIESRSIDYVCRAYGEEHRDRLEGFHEKYSNLETYMEDSYVSSDKSDMVSLVEYWYKDKDNDVCLLTFVEDLVLRDDKKIFYKDTLVTEEETDEETGEVIEKMYEKVLLEAEIPNPVDPQGPPVLVSEEVNVRPHIIKRFPFIVWYNTPKEKSFRGISDVEVVKDQQIGLNKVLSNEQRKVILGTTKIFVRKGSGLKGKITDAALQIIETDNPMADMVVHDMSTGNRSSREFISMLDSFGQQISGITNASQGLIATSLSGQAIQQLTMNAQQRLTPKKVQKNIAYTQLYRLCFEFMLAFYDDRVPFRYDKDNSPTYGHFDKSALCKMDEGEEFYYPLFDVSVQVDDGIAKDRKAMIDMIMAIGNHMEPADLWEAMERVGFPGAEKIKDRAIEREGLQEAQMELQKAQQEFASMQNEIVGQLSQGGGQGEMPQV